jgi:DNA-binding YbaB/EbfC family protein
MSSMRKLLKQAQDMQDKMQRELGDTFAEASVGGGMVTVKMNGHKHLVAATVEADAMDPDDPSMLGDLIVAAVNEANRKMDDTLREKMGIMANSLPSLF